jgi:hypothetical protein
MSGRTLDHDEKRAITIRLTANEILLVSEAIDTLAGDYPDGHPEEYTLHRLEKRLLAARNKYKGGD